MQWIRLMGNYGATAMGSGREYLFILDATPSGEPTGARLTRWTLRMSAAPLTVAREAASNVIILPLGRGPGRPAMGPEADALFAVAKAYAERFEAGESLEGYPQWQHGQRLVPNEGPLVTKTGRVLTDADVQGLADEAERGYDVSDGLAGVDGHTERGHTPDGPAGCRRCQLLRDNQHWVSL